MSFDAILFDLDGTLIQTPEIIINAFIKAINTYYPNIELSEDVKTNVLGQTLDKAFKDYAKDSNELALMIKEFRKYSNSEMHKVKGYDDLELVLKTLKDSGYKLGIVTSKGYEIAKMNLEDLDVFNYFDCFVTYQDTDLHKPNPEPVLLALDKLNVNSDRAIYIGDHENDIKAGNSALVKTGVMKYSYRLNNALLEKPNYVFKNLKEILRKIESDLNV